MISKYIQQFMDDNQLLPNEEFYIADEEGQQVFIENCKRFRIIDSCGGKLEAVLDKEKMPSALLLESTLCKLLQWEIFLVREPFYPKEGEKYYYVTSKGVITSDHFAETSDDFLRIKYIGVFKTREAAEMRIKPTMEIWDEIKTIEY